MTVIKRIQKTKPIRFSKGGRFQGMGKNTSSKIVGARGRRVRIPRTADSFKSRTDHT